MSFWTRLFRPKASAPVSSGDIKRGDGVWEAFTGVSQGTSGPPSEQAALTVSSVYGCVNLIAGAISALPMHVYQRAEDGDRTRDPNNPLWWTLNEEFSPRWSAAAGWSFIVASKLLHGDAFAEIVRNRNGQIRGLLPLHPNRVEPIARPDGMGMVYRILPDPTIAAPDAETGKVRVIDQTDMLHVPGFGFNGLRSLSPLRHALRVSGRLALNAQTFSSEFLQNAARPEIAIRTEKDLTDEQFLRLKAMIAEHAGPMNAGRPMLLEGGLDVKTLTMPLEEMQLLETRRFQVEEIARIYGVPPFMIGHTEKTTSWGTGVEAMGVGFVRFTLRDHLNAFQNEINRKFFRTARTVAEFDTTELERADTKSLFEAFRVALGRAGEPGWMSVEEVRARLNLSRRVDGTLPTNAPVAPTSPNPATPTQ